MSGMAIDEWSTLVIVITICGGLAGGAATVGGAA